MRLRLYRRLKIWKTPSKCVGLKRLYNPSSLHGAACQVTECVYAKQNPVSGDFGQLLVEDLFHGVNAGR